MAMMMTIIAAAATFVAAAAAAAAAADVNCRRRWEGEERSLEEMCLCVLLRTWMSWQPSEEGPGHRTSLLQGPLPCSRSPNQWEQRGEGIQQLQNSLKSRRRGRM